MGKTVKIEEDLQAKNQYKKPTSMFDQDISFLIRTLMDIIEGYLERTSQVCYFTTSASHQGGSAYLPGRWLTESPPPKSVVDLAQRLQGSSSITVFWSSSFAK
ncbi:hypothetical protein AAC387_Pa02g3844 [Persea americana]